MRPYSLLFMLFLVVPFVEIYLLIEVGRRIGSLATIFLLVFTAVLGALLVRMQGMHTYIQIQQAVNEGRMPAVEMIEGVMIMVAGMLLLTPGFATDTIGFLLLIPVARRGIIRGFLSRQLPNEMPLSSHSAAHRPTGRADNANPTGRVIEGELDDQ